MRWYADTTYTLSNVSSPFFLRLTESQKNRGDYSPLYALDYQVAFTHFQILFKGIGDRLLNHYGMDILYHAL